MLVSCGLPTDDLINSPVGSNWDTILRTLIKTFKLTNWTKHWRSCLGESLNPFKIPPWKAYLSARLQLHNWLWQKVARRSFSLLAWSHSIVSSQSISSPVCKTGLGSPELLREFIAGCEWRHNCDIQLQWCKGGQTWTSYLGFNFHSLCPQGTTGKMAQQEGTWKCNSQGFLLLQISCKLFPNTCNQMVGLSANLKYFHFFHSTH